MRLGLFDVIGPIMHGPSSNHTAGAARIGYLAGQIMGGVPGELTFSFHPMLMSAFMGHRTHLALTAGCLGIREDSPNFDQALRLAAQKGISLRYRARSEPDTPKNFMGVSGRVDGVDWDLQFDSVGGGTVRLLSINGVAVSFGGGSHLSLLLAKKSAPTAAAERFLHQSMGAELVSLLAEGAGNRTLLCAETVSKVDRKVLDKAASLLGKDAVVAIRETQPVYPFPLRGTAPPCTPPSPSCWNWRTSGVSTG